MSKGKQTVLLMSSVKVCKSGLTAEAKKKKKNHPIWSSTHKKETVKTVTLTNGECKRTQWKEVSSRQGAETLALHTLVSYVCTPPKGTAKRCHILKNVTDVSRGIPNIEVTQKKAKQTKSSPENQTTGPQKPGNKNIIKW